MIPLHEPRFDQSDEEFVLQALRSTWVSTSGPFVDRFEKEFAAYVGAEHAVSVANGTAGLHLMLDSLRRLKGISGPFDVLVPSLSFIATANAVVQSGGVPILCDVEAGRMNASARQYLDIIRAKYRLDQSTRLWHSKKTQRPILAVMPAHIMGWFSDEADFASLSRETGIMVVQDAAEALGCFSASGRHVGIQTQAACYSFNGNKIITTGGGGMVVTNDASFAKRLKHLSTTAKVDSLRYVHDEAGYNYRLVNILAALGCAQLAKLPSLLAQKREIFNSYKEALHGTGVELHEEKGCISNNWLVNAIFVNSQSRDQVLLALIEAGVQARPLWTPIHLQPAFKYLEEDTKSFPNTEAIWQQALSLPSSPHLRREEIREIADIIAPVRPANAK